MDIIFTEEDINQHARNKPLDLLTIGDINPQMVDYSSLARASSVFCVTSIGIVSLKNRNGCKELIFHNEPHRTHRLLDREATPNKYYDMYTDEYLMTTALGYNTYTTSTSV